jgi:hypothetical protein
MNTKRIGIGTLVALAVASIYGTLIWFGLHADALDTHEREIDALQGELLETAKVNKILQQGLLEDIQELESRIAASENDTRNLVANTDRSLRETVEWTEQSLGISMRDEVNAVHREIADLSGLVAETRLALQQTQIDVDFLAVATAEEVEIIPEFEITLPPIHIPPPELVVNIEELEEETATCPIEPDNASKARRILTRAMGRMADTGSYLFGATFNINTDGTTENIEVVGGGPINLRKAVARYAAALEWTVDEAVNDCELKLKLDIE